ncbi:hypothetical protein M406DRAFT_323304 [Cryphonectria parasitica EP155]|uniref:RecQ-mediated genome instability protein 1 n=1 Tax=Cryphonectria parasitica (strain ATCC 38755 / EP155) TaxID=660469 RepID=A0A9P4XZI6_CRYP1|nr:uncharacterized protein M406DRAFT_323304 [Cryphonectria parasitica EP155]KAF3763769.1 hypothetical protein M406DRAFT_323304 [Cryphonectria parasitica EP155]
MSLASQILTQLQPHHIPPPSQEWLQTLVSSRNPPPPLNSLVMTAKTRLLASDLTTPGLLDAAKIPTICLPEGVAAPTVKETRLGTDVYVQVVDIENLSKSRWDQVEALEAIERGEQTRGREVIRLPVGGSEGDELAARREGGTTTQADNAGASRNVTHRLLLQDCRRQQVYGLELVRLPEITIGSLNIGSKILLKKGTIVSRGVIMLEPSSCQFLGGKVDAWHKAWTSGLLARLREAARAGD